MKIQNTSTCIHQKKVYKQQNINFLNDGVIKTLLEKYLPTKVDYRLRNNYRRLNKSEGVK